MKKLLALILVLCMAIAIVACNVEEKDDNDKNETSEKTSEEVTAEATEGTTAGTTAAITESTTETTTEDEGNESTGVMSYAEYIAAEMDAEVVIEAYVQATQSWWDNKITVYLQDEDGAYFAYEMACSEEDAAKLTKGTKIRVTGYKGEWAGEVEIMDATFEFVEAEAWVAEAFDATALLGTDDLIKHQNEFVVFKGVESSSVTYKNGEPGDDIYVEISYNGAKYSFCVERYLTGPETEVYKAFETIKAGDIVDIEGFLYWYEAVNTHITAIAVAK